MSIEWMHGMLAGLVGAVSISAQRIALGVFDAYLKTSKLQRDFFDGKQSLLQCLKYSLLH